MDNLSVSLARLAARKPRTVVSTLVLICCACVFITGVRGFNSNLVDLIPEHARKTQLYLKLVRDFGMADDAYIVLEGDLREHMDKVQAFAGRLSSGNLLRDVRYGLPPAMRTFVARMFRENALLYLNDEELTSALERLSPGEMERQLRKAKRRLVLPSGVLVRSDPLSFHELLLSRTPSLDVPVDMSSGYFLSGDGRRLFVLATPTGEARDIEFDGRLMEGITQAFRDTFGDSDAVSLGVTGNHAITLYEQRLMKRDMIQNTAASLFAVGALFWFFFGTLRSMVYAFIPVGVAVVAALGVSAAFLGALSEVSGAFGALLVGLGVDLTIVLFVRYIEEADMESSIRRTSGAIWTGVLTTAATFYPMVLSDFRGIREFGFLTATGIIICGVSVFLLAAPLMKRKKHPAPRGTGLEGVALFALRHKAVALTLCIGLGAVSAYSLRYLSFSADLQTMGSQENPARKLFVSLGVERDSTLVTGVALSVDHAVEQSAAAVSALRVQGITETISLASFVPSMTQQSRNISRLRAVDVERAVERFRAVAARLGFSREVIEPMAGSLRKFLTPVQPVTLGDLEGTGVERFLGRFYRVEGEGYRYLVMGRGGTSSAAEIGSQEITGTREVRAELSSLLKGNAAVITVVGMALVNVIIFIRFRSVVLTLFAQLPVLLSLLMTGAIMTLFDIEIHLMNAVVAVMLFGIGTDYAIHLIHSLVSEGTGSTRWVGTSKAISLAAFTTIVGFGSLCLSSYRGVAEMGLAVGIGSLLTVLFTLLLIPALVGLAGSTLRAGGDYPSRTHQGRAR